MKRIAALAGCLTLASLACRGEAPATAASSAEVVSFDGALASSATRAEGETQVTARLRLGTRSPTDVTRAPANVALVVDTSGSMEGKAIEDARSAALTMVDGLADGDRLAIVGFGASATLLFPSTELDDDARADAHEKLAAMRADGTTDMTSGLRMGLDEVSNHRQPGGIDRVVLLGDGVPNDEPSVRPIADKARTRGITITALGLGPDYDETVMGRVAQLSGGRFHYVDDSSKIGAFLREEVLRLSGVYARGAAVDFTAGPGVRIDEVIGQRTSVTAGKVHVDLGDMSRGETRDIFVRLTVPGRRSGAAVEVLDAVLGFESPANPGVHVERRVFLGAHATSHEAELTSGRDVALEQDAGFAIAAAATVTALDLARAGARDSAVAALEQAAAAIDAIAKQTGSQKLTVRASELRALAGDLPAPAWPNTPAAGAEPMAPPSPAPARLPADVEASARRVREMHDDAMQRLQ